MTDPYGVWPRPHPTGLPIQPARPVYQEPHPVAGASVLAGVGATVIWFALFGAIGRNLPEYAWWTIVATLTAWAVALVLAVLGDRGVAAGVAVTAGLGMPVATLCVATSWIATNNWPLW